MIRYGYYLGVMIVLLLVASSCSRQTTTRRPQFSERDYLQDRRSAHMNRPYNELGVGGGVSHLSSAIIGTLGDGSPSAVSADYFKDNIHPGFGLFYRMAPSHKFNLYFDLQTTGFSGQVSGSGYSYYRQVSGTLPEGNEDNFFDQTPNFDGDELSGLEEVGLERFSNNLVQFSVRPAFTLSQFGSLPFRLQAYTGLSLLVSTPSYYAVDELGVEYPLVNDDKEAFRPSSSLAVAFPLGLNLNWQISSRVSLSYELDYRFATSRHPSGADAPLQAEENPHPNDKFITHFLRLGFRVSP